MKVSFRTIWETWATPQNISCFSNRKVRFWSVYVFFLKFFGSKIRTLFFLLIILISVEKKIRFNKIDWDPVELSGKTAMISTKLRPPQNYYLFWIDHLVGKSSFKRRTQVFSFYIIGEMFKTNELFVDSCTLAAQFSFCVFIFSTEYAMTCHETKLDNAILVDLYPFLKHRNSSGIFSFLYIVFYWNNNLKLCFSLADTAVKNG